MEEEEIHERVLRRIQTMRLTQAQRTGRSRYLYNSKFVAERKTFGAVNIMVPTLKVKMESQESNANGKQVSGRTIGDVFEPDRQR